jgi:hypothetical protein
MLMRLRPDVTQIVGDTLGSIDNAFVAAGTLQQLGACVGLFMPPYALDAWDMNSVLSIPYLPSPSGANDHSLRWPTPFPFRNRPYSSLMAAKRR